MQSPGYKGKGTDKKDKSNRNQSQEKKKNKIKPVLSPFMQDAKNNTLNAARSRKKKKGCQGKKTEYQKKILGTVHKALEISAHIKHKKYTGLEKKVEHKAASYSEEN